MKIFISPHSWQIFFRLTSKRDEDIKDNFIMVSLSTCIFSSFIYILIRRKFYKNLCISTYIFSEYTKITWSLNNDKEFWHSIWEFHKTHEAILNRNQLVDSLQERGNCGSISTKINILRKYFPDYLNPYLFIGSKATVLFPCSRYSGGIYLGLGDTSPEHPV